MVLVKAGYQINSVEVAFIVPSRQVDNFRITSSKVDGCGLLNMYTRYGTPPTEDPKKNLEKRFTQNREHDQIQVYGLDMSSMDYPASV